MPQGAQVPTTNVSVSAINTVVDLPSTNQSSLGFLNGYILPEERPGSPNMSTSGFGGKIYYQNNNQGACNDGNCNCNGNCGNINCRNCIPGGAINCANCQAQSWLQTNNCNCACTYNCTPQQTSYACNCACNCSKIICAKLYEFGLMNQNIWAADQAYGKWLRKTDRSVYQGYVRWARIVTAWMDGRGPNYMPWIQNKEKRIAAQKAAITDMAIKIGTPWSEHMAHLMGALPQDNTMGRILMTIGKPICRFVNLIPRTGAAKRRHSLPTLYTMWALFYFSYYTAKALTPVVDFIDSLKISDSNTVKES
jgi:hypothetical protein